MTVKLKTELQKYLNKVCPGSKIERPHSIFGAVHIRFELGGDEIFKIFRNGIEFEWWKDRRKMTKIDKVNIENNNYIRTIQATARATTIFNNTFDNLESELYIIIYHYFGGLFNNLSDYLMQQFSSTLSATFYDKIEEIETQMISTDNNGVDTFDKVNARLIIGKVKVKDIKTENILNGIANNELGFEPNICQDIYFLDPINDRGFYMYDDRGCYVWSNKAEKII